MQIKVIAHPNSKKLRVEKDLFGSLQVYVNKPALEGKATLALPLALVEYFKVKNIKSV
ncbi:MAG: DUF167 domain-containing protein [Patescibacteria group bacterium]